MDSSVLAAYGLPIFTVLFLASLMIGGRYFWRVPVLAFCSAHLLWNVTMYMVLRLCVLLVEALFTSRLFNRDRLERQMKKATSFQEWSRRAEQLDQKEGHVAWKAKDRDPNYHPAVLRAAVLRLRAARQKGDAAALMDALKLGLSRNFGGHLNWEMYVRSNVGTKHLIQEFVQEMESGLDWIEQAVDRGELDDRLALCADFVHDAGTTFGTSCLFLSGGAANGFYHFGIIRPLLAEGALPNLVCGTSMGAIAAAYLAVRTDEEAFSELKSLKELYHNVGQPAGPMQGAKWLRYWRVFSRGYMYDHEHVLKHLEYFTKGLTFAEAFERTGRVVSITCTPEKTRAVKKLPPLLLNHIYSPNVTISSAIMASSCVPGLMPLVTLQERVNGVVQPWREMSWAKGQDSEGLLDKVGLCPKRKRTTSSSDIHTDSIEEVQMRDGSFESDVPIETMRSLFNTQYSIVSQVNPHIVPFYYDGSGSSGRPIRWPWRNYRGGFLFYFAEMWIKDNMIFVFKVLRKSGILFNVVGVDWSTLFTQQEFGETNIIPTLHPINYLRILENEESLQAFSEKTCHSERNVWRNLTQIQARMGLQRALRRVGDAVQRATERPSAVGVRDLVLRRCGFVQASTFQVRGAQVGPGSEPCSPANGKGD